MLGKYSFGIGDRFAKEGVYQLLSFAKAKTEGFMITPVWNKSYREHQTVKSSPASVRAEANESIEKLGWEGTYLVDADHITLETVDEFIPHSDFFTIDVADQIGQELSSAEIEAFINHHKDHIGQVQVAGLPEALVITEEDLIALGNKFFQATKEAHLIYKKISQKKKGFFVVEVSMDEVDEPQLPMELYFILMLLSDAGVPVNTIAPKFSGRFNKGVDYKGSLTDFEKEFERDLLIIAHCVKVFDLPSDLKLSIHTGSDKFSLYPIINRLIKKHDCGLHLKTAGTTWLEEVIGLAESEGSGLLMAKSIYEEAYTRFYELTEPYATVIEVDKSILPTPDEVNTWSGEQFSAALSHDQSVKSYDPNFRQLLHTAYKVAAEKGDAFLLELEKNSYRIGKNVTRNIFDRHIKPLFL